MPRSSFGTDHPFSHILIRGAPALASIVLFLVAWQAYAELSGIKPATLPSPSRVFMQGLEHREALWDNTLPTIAATLLGFAASVVAAFALSVLIDFSTLLKRALFPIIIISQTLPLVAIAPLVVLWFGFELTPKIVLVALVTFFPMLVALVRGYASTEDEIEQLLRSMGATQLRIFLLARLPSALPYFFAGIRISITYAVVGAIFAEYAGAAKGLGIYILNAKNNFRPDLVLAAVGVSAGLTLLLFALAVLIEGVAMPWQRAEAFAVCQRRSNNASAGRSNDASVGAVAGVSRGGRGVVLQSGLGCLGWLSVVGVAS